MTDVSEFYLRVETECPAFQARITARALTRYYNACFRPLRITTEQFSLLVGIGGNREPTLAEMAARRGRRHHSQPQRQEPRAEGSRAQPWRAASKRMVLTDAGVRLMDEAMVAWERARNRLAEALGEEASRIAGSVLSQLAVAGQAAASAVSSKGSSGPKLGAPAAQRQPMDRR
jgi:hypothetical protein